MEGSMKFPDLVRTTNANQGRQPFAGCLLALDPGETTGWACFNECDLVRCGQITGSGIEVMVETAKLIRTIKPDVVICEGYRIYSWKKDQHTWSDLFTPRLIGVIEYVCATQTPRVPLVIQMAGTVKAFCKDDKLRKWGYWQVNKKHARDAIRHACYWLLFHKEGFDEQGYRPRRTTSDRDCH